MERKASIENAKANLSLSKEMLDVVKFMENSQGEDLYPKIIAKLHDEHDKLIARGQQALPLSIDYYQEELDAQEFIFKVFSALPKKESLNFSEILGIAKFFEDQKEDNLRVGLWDLLDRGLLEWTSGNLLKVPDNLK